MTVQPNLFAEPVPVIRIGPKRTLHQIRVLIEDGRVVVRTSCGITPPEAESNKAYAVPTCNECEAS